MNHLVIFAPNWLGDAVMALPAIADIRRAAPGATIAVAARKAVAPLFTTAPGIDRILTLGSSRAADVLLLRAGGFDAALLLPNSFRTAWTARRAGIPERWGYRADWRGPLLTRAIARPHHVHQAASYQTLVGALGFPSGPLEPLLDAAPATIAAGVRALAAAGWDPGRPLVVLAPGAAYGSAKQWPTDRFAAVAAALLRDGAAIAIVGAAGDREAGVAIERDLASTLGGSHVHGGRAIMNLTGRTDLPALAGILLNSRGLVTNDSGAMHVAAALGVPVTAMFGPTKEQETRPLGPVEAVVLTHPVWCRPCMLRTCPIDHRCMRGIPVDAVLAGARRAL